MRPSPRERARPRARGRIALLLTLLLGGAAACRPPEDPAVRYRRFERAAREGDAATAWALLSTASQRELAARSKALAHGDAAAGPDGGAPAGVSLDPRQLLLGDLAPTAPKVKAARVAHAAGDEAVVEVELEDGGRGEVTLRREEGGWRVVLPPG